MAKREFKKNEIINTRITILFFWLFPLCGLLWAENFARYRYDYIFRDMLPWLMPIALVIAAAVLALVILHYFLKGKKEKERIFSSSFLIYLMLPLPAIVLFPWLTLFGNGLQLFKLAIWLLFFGLIGYFISYLLYHLVRPGAALLGWSITANALALTYFYEMYLAPSRYILNIAEYGYLPAWAVAIILAILLALALGSALFTAGFSRLSLPKMTLLPPAALAAVSLLATTLFDSLMSGTLVRIFIFGSITLQVLWLIVITILMKLKKL